jgi:hypothetical protein
MFIYMHYDGNEPPWALSLRGLVPAFTPAYPFAMQEESLAAVLADKKPSSRAGTYAEAFQLDAGLWKPLSDAREVLLAADQLATTDHLVWRDQWLLSRADAVIVENGSTLEVPLLAALWGIPVVAVSFTPMGMHPWLAKTAQITVNSPTSAEQILGSLGVQFDEEDVPEGDESGEELPELPKAEEVIS